MHKAWKAYQDRGTTNNAPRPGRSKSDRHTFIVDDVCTRINANPNVSIRGLAREFEVPVMTMHRLVKEDLGLKSLTVVQVQQLTPARRAKRLELCRGMLNKLRREAACKVLVLSDEKDCHLNKHLNKRNHRIIGASAKAVDPAHRFQGRPKFPQKAMFFGYMGSDGKVFPGVWVKGTVDTAKYKTILIRHVIPTLDRTYGTYGRGNYIWMQDGAPAHTSKAVLSYLKSKLSSKGFGHQILAT